jgi:hypothetical protein
MFGVSTGELDDRAATDDVTAATPPVDVEQLIRELDAAYNNFPEATLRACQANRELVIPRLIEVLEHTVRVGQEGAVRVGNTPIYALFLLAEFEALEALPLVMDLVKLPHDVPDDLLGDAITEYLPRLLAIFAGNTPDLLDELIAGSQFNEYVRSSAVRTYAYLVRDCQISREDAIAHLKRLLATATEQQNQWITAALIDHLLTLNANEARTEIEEAFRRNVVDEDYITPACVQRYLRPDQPDWCDLDHIGPTKITDTIEELRGWYWPGDVKPLHRDDSADDLPLVADFWDDSSEPLVDSDYVPSYPSTIRNEAVRVGRNDPCPCGSGKKYKKCCLRQSAGWH